MRSFGRVNGRKLRVGQTDLMENLLPKLAVDVNLPLSLWESRFSPIFSSEIAKKTGEGNDVFEQNLKTLTPTPSQGEREKIWLEIGFGYGEHLVGLAQQYPDVTFIGCEPFANGVATILKQIQEAKLENIRILHGDARLLIEKLPENSVERVFILFPDPWPKSKHHKKRIITNESLKAISRIMKPGARLDIATDHVDYGIWIDEHLTASDEFKPNDAVGIDSIPNDWVETRYQKKALSQGRGARFFNYNRY